MVRVLVYTAVTVLAIAKVSAAPQYGGESGGDQQQQSDADGSFWWLNNDSFKANENSGVKSYGGSGGSSSSGDQNTIFCNVGQDCVLKSNCVNGIIDISGSGSFDLRGGVVKCEDPAKVCCALPSDGKVGPGPVVPVGPIGPVGPVGPGGPLPNPFGPDTDPCWADEDCVIFGQCEENGFISTSGAGLFDLRFGPKDKRPYRACSKDGYGDVEGQCCRIPLPDLYHDNCPGGTTCTTGTYCQTDYDWDQNLVMKDFFGQFCKLGSGDKGVCCAPKLTIYEKDSCPGGTICTDLQGSCRSDYVFVAGVDQSHFGALCHWDKSSGARGICCAPELIHDSCPGGTICSDASQCEVGYEFDSQVDTSFFNQRCHWDKNTGARGVCCAPKLNIYDTCPGGTICSDLQACETGYDFATTVDNSFFNELCHWDKATGARGVCCAPKLNIYDTCPGGTICSDLQACETGYDFATTVDNSFFNELCHWDKATGARGVCCAPKLTIHDTCPGGTVCQDLNQCGDYSYHSSIDSASVNSVCHWDKSTGARGVCCAPRPVSYGGCAAGTECTLGGGCQNSGISGYSGGSNGIGEVCFYDASNNQIGTCCPSPYISCPEGAGCTFRFEDFCKGQVLDVSNQFIDWSYDAAFSECLIEGGDGITGVCCRQFKDPYVDPRPLPGGDKCGVRNEGYSPKKGQEVDTRIQSYVGKDKAINEAEFGEFPWQGILFFSNYTFKCGVSLIDNNFAITAAHCVNGYYAYDFKLRFGEWKVSGFDEPRQYVDRKIAKIIVHPQFDAKSVYNNFAILELDKPIQYEYHISSICLPKPGYVFSEGTRCFATGWGKDSFDGRYQHIMKKVDLPVIEDYACNALLKKTKLGKYYKLHDSFMCAGGEEGKDACTGDGGGPLACQDPTTGSYVLAGITAYGVGCGIKDVPGVYAEVSTVAPWIESIISGYKSGGGFEQQTSGGGAPSGGVEQQTSGGAPGGSGYGK